LKIFLSILLIFHNSNIKYDLPIKWNQRTKFRCSMIKIKRKNDQKNISLFLNLPGGRTPLRPGEDMISNMYVAITSIASSNSTWAISW